MLCCSRISLFFYIVFQSDGSDNGDRNNGGVQSDEQKTLVPVIVMLARMAVGVGVGVVTKIMEWMLIRTVMEVAVVSWTMWKSEVAILVKVVIKANLMVVRMVVVMKNRDKVVRLRKTLAILYPEVLIATTVISVPDQMM